MKVTKHAAELCSLLVNDIYGELPCRIIEGLLRRGPCRLPQLAERTGLNPPQVRHGLAALVQQNLVHYSTRPETDATTYEANFEACYNLLRIGKIIDLVGRQYGLAEQEVVRSLVALGHVQVTDLAQAFGAQCAANARELNAAESHPGASTQTNGTSSHKPAEPLIKSVFHLHEVVGRLIQWEVLDIVEPESFANLENVYAEIDEMYNKKVSAAKGPKAKDELSRGRALKLREARDRGKQLKRQLDSEDGFPSLKKRRLVNGDVSSDSPQRGQHRILDPGIVVRLNYEKCLVDLRNERLVRLASDILGDTTSRVYQSLLQLITQQISRCRPDPRIDGCHSSMFEDESSKEPTVTTADILENLDPSTTLSTYIARVSKEKIDEKVVEARLESEFPFEESSDEVEREGARRAAKRRRTVHVANADTDADAGAEDSEEEDDKVIAGEAAAAPAPKQNGTRQTLVKFENVPEAKDKRLDLVRRHLILLCDDRRGFVKGCGKRGEERWTVDFDVITESLREAEMDSIIERTAGRFGVRLISTLREYGKLDEKTLAGKTFLKKPHMQATMAELQKAGFVDVQEVPKDSSRLANRTMYLWFCDGERMRRQLPDRLYKVILRCLQVLEGERHKTRDILDFVHRTDVKGKEEEVMGSNFYVRYCRYMELESQLLSHAMRLDETVAVLRDY